jgi:hypothetical protein
MKKQKRLTLRRKRSLRSRTELREFISTFSRFI